MPKLTGGQALARALYEEGVRVIFGLPGVQLYHAMDGLYEVPEIRFITTRHEQATTYMADGYARAGGGIGTALVVPGPGLQNASAGIGTAYSASSPILVVAGQVQKELIGVERGVLHEVHDQMDTIRPVTKWSQRILDARTCRALCTRRSTSSRRAVRGRWRSRFRRRRWRKWTSSRYWSPSMCGEKPRTPTACEGRPT